uniref:Uncharacterized protein n=1 Tax=Cyprinus carpio TaxID=7962 RepID=A0A8C1M9X9_CYPCA
MAEARFSQDELMCPVCLDLLKDPVSIQCGHNYCKRCITGFWDQEEQMRVYSCPQCRQTFSPRPVSRNTMLAELVEKLKKTKLSADCYAGAGDVQCDVCAGRKHKAVKSCLVCLNSYCQNHLEQHENSHQLTLDLNTVNKHLRLSESNRVITGTLTEQLHPDHPDRFDHWWQVLCRESVCGRCYWELEWSGSVCGVSISVSYKSISRKGRGKECWFGRNDQSWSLFCTPSSYSFIHNNIQTVLPVKSISSRIGVFVDHSAGILSFYSVSDTMSLIHTVQTTFTQPLYPGFFVSNGSSVKLREPANIQIKL